MGAKVVLELKRDKSQRVEKRGARVCQSKPLMAWHSLTPSGLETRA